MNLIRLSWAMWERGRGKACIFQFYAVSRHERLKQSSLIKFLMMSPESTRIEGSQSNVHWYAVERGLSIKCKVELYYPQR